MCLQPGVDLEAMSYEISQIGSWPNLPSRGNEPVGDRTWPLESWHGVMPQLTT